MKKALPILLVTVALLGLDSCKKYDTPKPEPEEEQPPLQLAERKCHTEPATIALDWYKLQLRILLQRNSSLNGAYFGYLGIGLYESVRNGINNAASLSASLNQMPAMPARENKKYHWPESANAAMASLLRSYNAGLTPAEIHSIDSLEELYNKKFLRETDAATWQRSQAFGKSIASAVYNWSLTDLFNPSNVGYIPKVFPGSWVPTLPAFANGINPYVGTARPFLIEDKTNVAPPFPAPYCEAKGSPFYNIVRNVYDVSKKLTQEQKDIALFWVDQGNGVGYTPPGHDFSVITQALEQAHANLATVAEAYAKGGIAERDATIVCFRSKYKYSLLRPITYIRKVIDTTWLPFIATPPHPEYPAAHAFVTGSAMQAVACVLGNNASVTDHTYDFRGWTPRTFKGLFDVAREAGISRLYGGIHYGVSIQTGLSLGYNLGNQAGKLKIGGHP